MLVLIFQSHQDPIFLDTVFGSSSKWLVNFRCSSKLTLTQ